MNTTRINHTGHNHPSTPAARTMCRKAPITMASIAHEMFTTPDVTVIYEIVKLSKTMKATLAEIERVGGIGYYAGIPNINLHSVDALVRRNLVVWDATLPPVHYGFGTAGRYVATDLGRAQLAA